MSSSGTLLRESALLVFEEFVYNPAAQRLHYLGKPRAAEPKVLRMLELLLERHGQAIPYEDLGAELWPDTHVEVRANLNTLALKLRRALSPHGHRYVQTAHGEGYRFNPQVPVVRRSVPAPLPEELVLKRQPSRRWITAAILSAVCVVIALAGWLFPGRPGEPAGFRIDKDELIVTDRNDREVFHHSFGIPLDADAYSPAVNPRCVQPWFGDLGGSGRPHILLPVRAAPSTRPFYETPLEYFGMKADGPPEWRFLPSGKVMFSSDDVQFEDHYGINQCTVLRGKYPDGRKIVVSSNHFISYPDQIAVLDAKGHVVSEYWHPGHLLSMTSADLAGDGREKLLLGGVNDGYGQAVLVVFDAAKVQGQAEVPAGDRHRFRGVGKGSEVATIFFPHSCLLRYNRVECVGVVGQTIYVHVSEALNELGPEVIYQLGFDFTVRGITVSNAYQEAHREMEDAGKLRHKFGEHDIKALRQIKVVRSAS